MNFLEQAVEARSQRRGLRTTVDGINYSNSYFFSQLSQKQAKCVLYVGVGHGLDVIQALLSNQMEMAIGVDPFISTDGNDDKDYNSLIDLIQYYDLQERFILEKKYIEDYLASASLQPDHIIIHDVLHHIYETADILEETPMFDRAAHMFSLLYKRSTDKANLLIADVNRKGLRQMLVKFGLLQSYINYSTKQNWWEWDKAITSVGWERQSVTNYVPYSLSQYRHMLNNSLCRYTVCDKYFLVYQK